jgi:hypothetical protein
MVAKYPDLFDEDKLNKRWFSMLKEVDFFLDAKGRRPQPHAKDPKEKHIGCWLSGRILDPKKDKLPADRMEAFQAMIAKYPDLLDEDKRDKVWYQNLEGVDSFIKTKGKRPRPTAKDP